MNTEYFLVCICLNVCVFVTVLAGIVSVIKEQELLLMVCSIVSVCSHCSEFVNNVVWPHI